MYEQEQSQNMRTPLYQQPHEQEENSSTQAQALMGQEICEPETKNKTGAGGGEEELVTHLPGWHPAKDSDGNKTLIAGPGDNFETLKAYLKGIYGSEAKIPKEEWDDFEEQIKFLQENVGQEIQGQQICSEKQTFDNLVGIYLVNKSETEPAWGYYNPSGVPNANACSPSLANRSALAVKYVYGEDSPQYKKLNRDNKMAGYIGYNQFQNNYGPKAKFWSETLQRDVTGDEMYKKRNAAKYGLTEEMRGHSVGGALEYSGTGEYVPEDKIWSGGLKPGAAIGLGFHTGIFIKYEYQDGKIVDIWYWDHHNEVKRVKQHDGYNVRVGGNWF